MSGVCFRHPAQGMEGWTVGRFLPHNNRKVLGAEGRKVLHTRAETHIADLRRVTRQSGGQRARSRVPDLDEVVVSTRHHIFT